MEELAHSQDLSPDDIIIPVMGITGSGKSTFISRCTGIDTGIGHGMQSFTKKVFCGTIKHKGRTIRLIDTPGFDDSELDDATILKEISTWLLVAYSHTPPLLLSGIIYLHPITNVRMKGTDKSNLAMFKALCGKDSLSCVVMATTMWAKVDPTIGGKRQKDLSEKYWNNLVDAGTSVVKHDDTKASALAILDHIIEQNTHITLNIQQELSSGTQLQDTDAGRELSRKLIEERERAEVRFAQTTADLEDAQERRDIEDAKAVLDMQLQYQRDIQAKELELEKMKVDMETLIKRKQEELRKEQEARDEQRKTDEDKLSKLTQTLTSINESEQELSADAEKSVKYESMDFSAADAEESIQAQIAEHKLKMQLEKERHEREMVDARRDSEMLDATRKGVRYGKVGAVAGMGSLAIGVGSLALASAEACTLM